MHSVDLIMAPGQAMIETAGDLSLQIGGSHGNNFATLILGASVIGKASSCVNVASGAQIEGGFLSQGREGAKQITLRTGFPRAICMDDKDYILHLMKVEQKAIPHFGEQEFFHYNIFVEEKQQAS